MVVRRKFGDLAVNLGAAGNIHAWPAVRGLGIAGPPTSIELMGADWIDVFQRIHTARHLHLDNHKPVSHCGIPSGMLTIDRLSL